MSEDPKIIIDYSDIQRAMEKDATPYAQPSAGNGNYPASSTFQPSQTQQQAPRAENWNYPASSTFQPSQTQQQAPRAENWNYPASSTFQPSQTQRQAPRSHGVSPGVRAKIPVVPILAVGSVITTLIVAFILVTALVLKAADGHKSHESGRGVAAGKQTRGFGGVPFSFGAVPTDNVPTGDGSTGGFVKSGSPIGKFYSVVKATESDIKKNFDYESSLLADKNNILDSIENYQQASRSVSEWTSQLAKIDVESFEYRDVPDDVKSNFERYRKAATELNEAFASYEIDDAKIKDSIAGVGLASVVGLAFGLALDDSEDLDNWGKIGGTLALDEILDEYNNQIRNLSDCCASCASERSAFEKSCSGR